MAQTAKAQWLGLATARLTIGAGGSVKRPPKVQCEVIGMEQIQIVHLRRNRKPDNSVWLCGRGNGMGPGLDMYLYPRIVALFTPETLADMEDRGEIYCGNCLAELIAQDYQQDYNLLNPQTLAYA